MKGFVFQRNLSVLMRLHFLTVGWALKHGLTERPDSGSPDARTIINLTKFNSTYGFWCLLKYNWTICSPLSHFLFQHFDIFFTFILGGQFLLPQRANTEKREFLQLQIWTRQRGLSAWGIQPGPFAPCWANFIPQIFQLFHFYTGRPILITPEGK